MLHVHLSSSFCVREFQLLLHVLLVVCYWIRPFWDCSVRIRSDLLRLDVCATVPYSFSPSSNLVQPMVVMFEFDVDSGGCVEKGVVLWVDLRLRPIEVHVRFVESCCWERGLGSVIDCDDFFVWILNVNWNWSCVSVVTVNWYVEFENENEREVAGIWMFLIKIMKKGCLILNVGAAAKKQC
jgi:hypothetical protein